MGRLYTRFSGNAVGIDDELVTTPHSAGNPEAAVDNLGVALVGGLDGREHAEAVAPRVDGLGSVHGGEEGVEDVTWAGEGTASAHFQDGWVVVGGLHHKDAFDYPDRPEASRLTEIVATCKDFPVTERT